MVGIQGRVQAFPRWGADANGGLGLVARRDRQIGEAVFGKQGHAWVELPGEADPRRNAGAAVELNPGFYFQGSIRRNSFDVPWRVFVSFPIKKDKIFGVIGAGGSLYQNPIVAPGGGLIWLFTDKVRLEGVFPKPALVYNPSDDWEFRIAGNLFFGGLVGWLIVDPLTGAMWTLDGGATATLSPQTSMEQSAATVQVVLLNDVPDSLRSKMVKFVTPRWVRNSAVSSAASTAGSVSRSRARTFRNPRSRPPVCR